MITIFSYLLSFSGNSILTSLSLVDQSLNLFDCVIALQAFFHRQVSLITDLSQQIIWVGLALVSNPSFKKVEFLPKLLHCHCHIFIVLDQLPDNISSFKPLFGLNCVARK